MGYVAAGGRGARERLGVVLATVTTFVTPQTRPDNAWQHLEGIGAGVIGVAETHLAPSDQRTRASKVRQTGWQAVYSSPDVAGHRREEATVENVAQCNVLGECSLDIPATRMRDAPQGLLHGWGRAELSWSSDPDHRRA